MKVNHPAAMSRWRWLLFGVLCGVLASAAGAVLWQQVATMVNHAPTQNLAQRLPHFFDQGRVEDLPLGPSEFADLNARQKMEYDDVVYRRFSSGGVELTVYVGYWSRGRRPASFVAAHTPDRCWTLAGMTRESFESGYQLSVGGGQLPPGEWRKFRDRSGRGYYVIFWHKVGDSFFDYEGRANSTLGYWQRAWVAVHELFWSRNEQYFIRLVSNVPFEALVGVASFKPMLTSLETFWSAPQD